MNLPSTPLMIFGFFGQALFSARFLVQWIVSESRRESVIPMAFWYFSIAGGVALLTYAVLRHDPVFTVGQVAGLVVYARNIMLVRRQKRQPIVAAEELGEQR
jgi:lipid-A-disaccharide synthase-like uncharacterized protein